MTVGQDSSCMEFGHVASEIVCLSCASFASRFFCRQQHSRLSLDIDFAVVDRMWHEKTWQQSKMALLSS